MWLLVGIYCTVFELKTMPHCRATLAHQGFFETQKACEMVKRQNEYCVQSNVIIDKSSKK